MKSKFLLSAVLIFSLSGGVWADKDEDTPLSKQMGIISKSLRTVKRQMADPAKKSDNLELIGKVKDAVKEAESLEPKKTKEQSDKPAYVSKFKEEMNGLKKTVGDLEDAIKADKPDDAKKALDKIYQEKDKGHKDFGVDED